MYLSELEVKNFKSVRDVKLELKKINLFIGTNNSGKSSLLQTLLFLKQCTTNINFQSPHNFGSFELLKHKKKGIKTDHVSIKASWNRRYGSPNKIKLLAIILSNEDNLSYFYSNGSVKLGHLRFVTTSKKALRDMVLNLQEEEIENDYISSFLRENKKKWFKQPHSYPYDDYSLVPRTLSPAERSCGGGQGILSWIEEWNTVPIPSEKDANNFRKLKALTNSRDQLKNCFDNMRVILVPRFINELVFRLRSNVPPYEEFHFSEDSGEFISNILTIKGALPGDVKKELVKWANRFGLTDLQTDILEKHGLELSAEEFEVRLPVAAMGSGSRQALALLGMSLYSKPRSILLIEEPEHSLHPEYQALMMDFFIEQVNKEKQLLITTHSEHILTRLQRKLAEGQIKVEDVGVFWVYKKENETKVKRVNLEADGTFPDGLTTYLDFIQLEVKAISKARRIRTKAKEKGSLRASLSKTDE